MDLMPRPVITQLLEPSCSFSPFKNLAASVTAAGGTWGPV